MMVYRLLQLEKIGFGRLIALFVLKGPFKSFSSTQTLPALVHFALKQLTRIDFLKLVFFTALLWPMIFVQGIQKVALINNS